MPCLGLRPCHADHPGWALRASRTPSGHSGSSSECARGIRSRAHAAGPLRDVLPLQAGQLTLRDMAAAGGRSHGRGLPSARPTGRTASSGRAADLTGHGGLWRPIPWSGPPSAAVAVVHTGRGRIVYTRPSPGSFASHADHPRVGTRGWGSPLERPPALSCRADRARSSHVTTSSSDAFGSPVSRVSRACCAVHGRRPVGPQATVRTSAAAQTRRGRRQVIASACTGDILRLIARVRLQPTVAGAASHLGTAGLAACERIMPRGSACPGH